MKDKLDVYESGRCWRIQWILGILDDGDDVGATIGEGNDAYTERDLAQLPAGEDWEHVVACVVASRTPQVARDFNGYYWKSSKEAWAALRMIRVAMRNKDAKPWPAWALQAKAAGWKPPKGWKP